MSDLSASKGRTSGTVGHATASLDSSMEMGEDYDGLRDGIAQDSKEV